MKVMLVTENLHEGGTQFFILRLAEALREKNIDAQVLLLNRDYVNEHIIANYPTVPILRFYLPWQKLLRKVDQLLFKLKSDFSLVAFFHQQMIRRKFLHEAVVFHTHYLKTDYLICKLKEQFPQLFHVVTVHGDYAAEQQHHQKNGRGNWNTLQDKLECLKQNVDHWVVISEEQRRFMTDELQVSATRVHKIYNGLKPAGPENNIANPWRRSSQDFIVGMAARGVEEKGWQVAIDAILKLNKNVRFLLTGEGGYLTDLKKKYSQEQKLVFLGFQTNVLSILSCCDVVVLPTHLPQESLPYSVIEALYCGKPVISSDTGEIRNMLTDEKTGAIAGEILPLINNAVQAEDLYKALLSYYMDRSLLQVKGETARHVFAKFSMELCVRSYLNIYNMQIAKKDK